MELIVQEILDDVWEVRKGSARDMGNEVGYSVWLGGGGRAWLLSPFVFGTRYFSVQKVLRLRLSQDVIPLRLDRCCR